MSTKILILLGPPGSGKGTQAKLLSTKNPAYLHVSTGDLFRQEISAQTDLGNSVKEILASGNLVSDKVTNQVFHSQLLKLIDEKKPSLCLLDGYPRTADQAKYLKELISSEAVLTASKALLFDLSEEAVVNRISGRLVNPRTGKVYHREFNPPKKEGFCDEDGKNLIQRSDDQPETVRARYGIYEKELNGILASLKLGDGEVERIDASRTPEVIFQEIEKQIEAFLKEGH